MNSGLRISIAMCTFNGEPFLREQLNSMLVQTRMPDELVVCDDGSTDESLSMLCSFAEAAKFPVRIVENGFRLGSTANFSQAISLCGSDIIVLADQDDIWHIEKLACIESAFAAKPDLGGLFTNGELIDAQGESMCESLWQSVGFSRGKQSAVRANKGFDALLRGNFVTGATLAFRGQFKHLLLPVPAGWVHDYWIASLLAAVSRLDLIETSLIRYRCHAFQQLGVKRNLEEQWRQFLGTDKAAYLAAERKWIEVYERLRRNDIYRDSVPMAKCQAIAAHMRRRGALPRQRLRRLPMILQEMISGNYYRYSLGLSSILRDMLAR